MTQMAVDVVQMELLELQVQYLLPLEVAVAVAVAVPAGKRMAPVEPEELVAVSYQVPIQPAVAVVEKVLMVQMAVTELREQPELLVLQVLQELILQDFGYRVPVEETEHPEMVVRVEKAVAAVAVRAVLSVLTVPDPVAAAAVAAVREEMAGQVVPVEVLLLEFICSRTEPQEILSNPG